MDVLYVVLFFIIMVVLYFAIPWLINILKKQSRRRGYNADGDDDTPKPTNAGNAKAPVLPLEDPIYLPVPSVKAEKKLEPTPDMVETYYKDNVTDVPEQYCRKPIGACPDSKPMSTDLPIANVPMCMATQSNNMRLSAK